MLPSSGKQVFYACGFFFHIVLVKAKLVTYIIMMKVYDAHEYHEILGN